MITKINEKFKTYEKESEELRTSAKIITDNTVLLIQLINDVIKSKATTAVAVAVAVATTVSVG